jgi:hypothetical protein
MPATTSDPNQATTALAPLGRAFPSDPAPYGVVVTTYAARARDHRYERLWYEVWYQLGLSDHESRALLQALRARRHRAALAAGRGRDADHPEDPMG